MSDQHPLTRRRFAATASVGLALPVLAACGSDDTATDSSSAEPSESPSSEASESESAGGAAAGAALASTSDIPVGGCAVFEADKVVVTQPTEGDFRAFSSTCTHQGCAVSASTDGQIPCKCHGSAFSIEDGSVVNGPATSPLAEVAITVDGDSITLA